MPVRETQAELDESIAWFLDHMAVERGASSNTVAAYEKDLHQWADWWSKRGKKAWRGFHAEDSAAARAHLGAKKLSASTIRRKLASLRSFLKFLAKETDVKPESLPDAAGIRRPKSLPKALTTDDIDQLFAQPNTRTPAGLRDRAMFELLYGAGLRISELVTLATEHYMESESLLRITGKRGKTRVVPIPSGTHKWLRKYLEKGRPKLVKRASGSSIFLNMRGRAISRSGVFRILREHAVAAGINSEIGPHTLRHTYAVHLVKAGADLRSVQELLGHASVATTEIYTHLDMETLRKKYIDAHPRAK